METMRKREKVRITRATPVDQLPEVLTRDEVSEYLSLGRSATYELLKQRGVKVRGMHRLRKEELVEMLQAS
jgi:hypothetical protein